MIDAINTYSSTHGGRQQNQTSTSNFGRLLKYGGDCFISKKASKASVKTNDLASLLLISGCSGAISMITDTLLSTDELAKSDFSTLKNISRNALIWAAIGGVCFAFFKGVEKLFVKD